jgi:hypothetical protein
MPVQVAAQPGEKLAGGPVLGRRCLPGCKFTGSQPTFYFTRPMMFNLPLAGSIGPQSLSSAPVFAFRLGRLPTH